MVPLYSYGQGEFIFDLNNKYFAIRKCNFSNNYTGVSFKGEDDMLLVTCCIYAYLQNQCHSLKAYLLVKDLLCSIAHIVVVAS